MSDSGLTEQQLDQLGHILRGTAKSVEDALDSMGLDSGAFEVSDVESDLADLAETCAGCGWSFEPGELAQEEEEDVGYCDDCAGER